MTDLPEWFRSMHSALDDRMGLEMWEVSPERVVGRMPVQGNTQPVGVWHGGASCVLAETLASIGAVAAVRPDKVAYGIEINATHHLTATAGHVTGTATALRIGRTLMTYEVVLVDDADRRICTARVTCMAASASNGS
jgi:1,4-dihydroxy-2-naphthoyl-CoA hydrolase